MDIWDRVFAAGCILLLLICTCIFADEARRAKASQRHVISIAYVPCDVRVTSK